MARHACHHLDILRAMKAGKTCVYEDTGEPVSIRDFQQNFENLNDTTGMLIGRKADVEMTPEGLKSKAKTTEK